MTLTKNQQAILDLLNRRGVYVTKPTPSCSVPVATKERILSFAGFQIEIAMCLPGMDWVYTNESDVKTGQDIYFAKSSVYTVSYNSYLDLRYELIVSELAADITFRADQIGMLVYKLRQGAAAIAEIESVSV